MYQADRPGHRHPHLGDAQVAIPPSKIFGQGGMKTPDQDDTRRKASAHPICLCTKLAGGDSSISNAYLGSMPRFQVFVV